MRRGVTKVSFDQRLDNINRTSLVGVGCSGWKRVGWYCVTWLGVVIKEGTAQQNRKFGHAQAVVSSGSKCIVP